MLQQAPLRLRHGRRRRRADSRHACCCVSTVIAPIIVGVLGVSDAVWADGLEPYGWRILGAAFVCLAFDELAVATL